MNLNLKPKLELPTPPRDLKRFSPLRLAVPALCVLFIVLLTATVTRQIPEGSAVADRAATFSTFMAFTAVLVAVLSLWSIAIDLNGLGLICATGILIAVGSSYHLLYSDYSKYCMSICLMLAAAAASYLVLRQVNVLPDKLFILAGAAVLALLVLNIKFGLVDNGAIQSIPLGPIAFHPGEFVKVLLMVLGAFAFRNNKRSAAYFLLCAVTCAVMVLKIRDLGGMLVVFACFLLMTYLLLDSKPITIGIIVCAIVAFVLAVNMISHVAQRMANWGNAMFNTDSTQQRSYLTAILYGGFDGLGVENARYMTSVFASEHDGALAGVLAVYGFPMLLVTIVAYGVLIAQPMFNRSIHPSGFLLQAQISMYIFCQVALNLGGGTDTLPFTGICAPIISEGVNNTVCFGLLLGMSLAVMHPKVKYLKEE